MGQVRITRLKDSIEEGLTDRVEIARQAYLLARGFWWGVLMSDFPPARKTYDRERKRRWVTLRELTQPFLDVYEAEKAKEKS
jgi:hypothetical protein